MTLIDTTTKKVQALRDFADALEANPISGEMFPDQPICIITHMMSDEDVDSAAVKFDAKPKRHRNQYRAVAPFNQHGYYSGVEVTFVHITEDFQ